MGGELHSRLREGFWGALERSDGDEREKFLREYCAGDEALYQEIADLLKYDADTIPDSKRRTRSAGSGLLEPGRELSHRFRIERYIASGGMGDVYLATDLQLRKQIAIKVLSERFATPETVERLRREVAVAQRVTHPNVCRVHDLVVSNEPGSTEPCFLTMELLEGETLAARLSDRGKLREEEAVPLIRGIAAALEALHQEDIVHRDLKPGNVMLVKDRAGRDFVKVMDFGIAKEWRETASLTQRDMQPGTPRYMSPEQRGEIDAKVSPASDVYGLGLVAYEMLAGRPLSRGTYAPIRDVSNKVNLWLRRCLSVQPEDRPRLSEGVGSRSGAFAALVDPARPRAAMAGLAAALAAAAIWYVADRALEAPGMSAAALVTSFPGQESQPAFSPHGDRIAFVWDGGQEKNYDIYVRAARSGRPLRLTSDRERDHSPVWAPDGETITFLRRAGPDGQLLMQAPALGGRERVLGRTNAAGVAHGLSWSPDGAWLALVHRAEPAGPNAIWLRDAAGGELRQLSHPPPGSVGDHFPAFSPDGESVAFLRYLSGSQTQLYVQPVAGGEAVRLEGEPYSGVAWLPSGRGLISAAQPLDGGGLLYAPLRWGKPRRLASSPDDYQYPNVAPDGSQVLFERIVDNVNIWSARLSDEGGVERLTTLNLSSRKQTDPQFSPDGARIVFASNRTGSTEIWMSSAEGEDPVSLTNFRRGHAGSPRWAPDGDRIAFDARMERSADIFVVEASGGEPRNVTRAESDEILPNWSHDNEWLYFASNRTGRFEIWKSRPDGTSPQQVTREGGFEAFESPDGKRLYYTKAPQTLGLWSIPVEGGTAEQVAPLANAGFYRYWAVGRSGVYFIEGDSPTELMIGPPLKYWSFETGAVRTLFHLPGRLAGGPSGLTIAPDEMTVLFIQQDRLDSDIVVADLE